MKTAIGFLGGQFGDLILQEPTVRAFHIENPEYNLILACNKKYYGALEFYRGYSERIVGLHAYEGYDESWPAKEDIDYLNEKKVDLLFNAMAQHKDYYWPKYRHQTIECGNMFDIAVADTHIHLPAPPQLIENKRYIALSLFPNNAVGDKAVSREKANAIAAYCRSKGFAVMQINGPKEPLLDGALQTDTDFYRAGVAMLGCRMLITGDTAMSWLASAFDMPTVGLYALEYYPFCETSKNWNPINKNAIYLEAGKAEEISNEEIFKAIDEQLAQI